MIDDSRRANLEQILHAVARDGFMVAQGYVEGAEEGDTRLFLMNGSPLHVRGAYAAVRRIPARGDARSNVHAGGTVARAVVTDEMLEAAATVGPILRADGMFLVGLDLIGSCLIEINVFSPGGLSTIEEFEGVDFTGVIAESIEFKVRARREDPTAENRRIAVLEPRPVD